MVHVNVLKSSSYSQVKRFDHHWIWIRHSDLTMSIISTLTWPYYMRLYWTTQPFRKNHQSLCTTKDINSKIVPKNTYMLGRSFYRLQFVIHYLIKGWTVFLLQPPYSSRSHGSLCHRPDGVGSEAPSPPHQSPHKHRSTVHLTFPHCTESYATGEAARVASLSDARGDSTAEFGNAAAEDA